MASVTRESGMVKAGFVDDDPSFLRTMSAWQSSIEMPVHATTSFEEVVRWIRDKEVDVLASDLRMPGRDGVAVLEEVHRLNPRVSLVLLTSFDPNLEERERLGSIDAKIFFKTENLPQFLDSLVERSSASNEPEPAQRLAELQGRVALLEALHQEWVADLVSQLGQIPNIESALISSGEGSNFSVAELISDIKELRPRGIEHIRLWRKALQRLRVMGKKA